MTYMALAAAVSQRRFQAGAFPYGPSIFSGALDAPQLVKPSCELVKSPRGSEKSFLGKAHFRVQPVGFSAFFFKMAQVGVLQQRPSAALSCNFAADVCPVFITDISFLSAVFPCASPLPCDGSG